MAKKLATPYGTRQRKPDPHSPPYPLITCSISPSFLSTKLLATRPVLHFLLSSLKSQPASAKEEQMSLRTTRSRSTKEDEEPEHGQEQDVLIIRKEKEPSLSQRAMTQALASTGHLANHLPTGTLLAFQLLTPVFTNNGSCDGVTRLLTQALLLVLAASCFLASFTDSFRSPDDGQLYYGLATPTGMWFFDYYPRDANASIPDLTKYRLRLIDCIHAVLSVLVFAAVAFRDRNVVSCFYPQPKRETQEALDIIPIGIGLICSFLFVAFPTRRHGIGYPVTSGN